MKSPSYWTEERISKLIELWKSGLTTTQIGNRLGRTRGAVAGKLDRLGLKRKGASGKKKDSLEQVLHKLRTENLPLKLALRRISWSRSTCSWPTGDPQSTEFSFCGAPVVQGKPYCNTHCFDAYTTTREGTN